MIKIDSRQHIFSSQECWLTPGFFFGREVKRWLVSTHGLFLVKISIVTMALPWSFISGGVGTAPTWSHETHCPAYRATKAACQMQKTYTTAKRRNPEKDRSLEAKTGLAMLLDPTGLISAWLRCDTAHGLHHILTNISECMVDLYHT